MESASQKIKVTEASRNRGVYVTFIHTDHGSCIAVITVEQVLGQIRMVRKTENDWVWLEDTIDRVVLYGGIPTPLELDIEKAYRKYALELIVK